MLTLVTLLSLTATPEKLVVLSFTPGGGLDPTVADTLTDSVTAELATQGHFEVISTNDVRTLLGVDRQRQLLGCGETHCYTELASVLGSRFVMSGGVSKLGEAFELNLQVLDTQTGKPLGRSSQSSSSLEGLRALIPYAAAEATNSARPEPPSKVLPATLIGVGSVAFVGGIVLGGIALSQDSALTAELGRPASESQPLDAPLSTYQQRANDIGTFKTISLAAMISGATLSIVGLVLFPKGPLPKYFAVVPSDRGFALVGVLP